MFCGCLATCIVQLGLQIQAGPLRSPSWSYETYVWSYSQQFLIAATSEPLVECFCDSMALACLEEADLLSL